jgi:hypothetical protein
VTCQPLPKLLELAWCNPLATLAIMALIGIVVYLGFIAELNER